MGEYRLWPVESDTCFGSVKIQRLCVCVCAVSYTHLDVYKRQLLCCYYASLFCVVCGALPSYLDSESDVFFSSQQFSSLCTKLILFLSRSSDQLVCESLTMYSNCASKINKSSIVLTPCVLLAKLLSL